MGEFVFWVISNSEYVTPIFILLTVICGILTYWFTYDFSLAMATEGVFCLLYIIAIWIPFHAQLSLDFAHLFGFIMTFILTSIYAIFGITKGGIGDNK